MNSKEIVQRTLNFQCPPRVAHSFFPSDFVWTGIHISAPQNEWKRVGELDWRRVDEWGNEWQKTNYSSKGKIIKGGLQKLQDIDSYQFPDFSNHALYFNTRYAFQNTPQFWHIGVLTGSTYEIANSLVDNYQSLVITDIDTIRHLHDRIDSVLKTQINGFKDAGADGVMIIEDLGETSQLSPGPSLWKEEFGPRIKSLCDFAHSLDLKVIMHSFQEVARIPELISSGIDCIQIDSPGSIGLDVLRGIGINSMYRSGVRSISIPLSSLATNSLSARSPQMLQMLWKGEGALSPGISGIISPRTGPTVAGVCH